LEAIHIKGYIIKLVNNPKLEKIFTAWQGLLKQDNGVLGNELYVVDHRAGRLSPN